MKSSKKLKALSAFLALFLAAAALPMLFLPASAKITATQTWYSSIKTVFTIRNASDLWAFASALQNGRTFEGATVYLNADITVNDNFEAFAETVAAPENIWPLTSVNKHFAGTFDGQGHTISGIYATTTGTTGYGLFGNVPTGKTATVKNLTIENSYIVNTNGAATGGIFGEVKPEGSTLIKDDYHVNVTKGVIENVHLNLNLVAIGKHSEGVGTSGGVGGFVGRNRADVTITNSSFDGKITTPSRGVAAFIGAAYPQQITHDHDGDGATTAYYPKDGNLANTTAWDVNGDGKTNDKDITYYKNNNPVAGNEGTGKVGANAYKTCTTIKDCVNTGIIDVSESGANRFAGAVIGYANSNAETVNLENFVTTGTFLGVSEGSYPIGYLFGGSWVSTNNYRNVNTTESLVWNLENVYVDRTSGNTYSSFGRIPGGMKVVGAEKNFGAFGDYLDSSMGQSITLKSDLALNFYVMAADPNATVTINGEPAECVANDGWMRCYTVDGLLPQQMTDEVTIRVSQTVGNEKFDFEKTTSIQEYCHTFFESDTATQAEKTLIADLLRYGDQAQIYSKYNTSSLATQGVSISEYGSSFVVKDIATHFAKSGTADANYDVNAARLALGNSLAMYLRFYAADTTDLTLTVSINERTETYDSSDFVALGGGQYMVAHRNVGAHEMNMPLTATLKKNGTQVGQSLTYSIADYVKAFVRIEDPKADEPIVTPGVALNPGFFGGGYVDESTRQQMELVSAMYKYGLSAEAYNDSNRCTVVNGNASGYVIVYDDAASAEIISIAHQLSSNIAKKTGVTLPVVADTQAQQTKEIIVGVVDGRSATTSQINQMTATSQNGYRMCLVGETIVIASYGKHQLSYAADHLVDALAMHGSSAWSLPSDYCEIVDVPSYDPKSGTTRQVYDAGNHNYTWSYTSTSSNLATEYSEYVSLLKQNGFVEYTKNSIGNSSFGTYVKNTNGYRTAVYVAHYPNTNNMRITYGPLDYLPDLDPVSVSQSDAVASPSMIINARETVCTGGGMSIIFQLVDGSFIVVDGGVKDGTVTTRSKVNGVWQNNPSKQSNDAQTFYELLCSMTPGDEKPVISAWFITHADGDHIQFPNYFLPLYHDKVDLKMLVHNFPDFEFASMQWNENHGSPRSGYLNAVNKLIGYVETYYPDAVIWTCHTGQKLQLAGCEIEIWYTPEDYYGDKNNNTSYMFTSANETCIAFRMTFGDQTVMMLGDSGWTILERMANNYGSAAQSDILQITHHGSNGGNYLFYTYVDPKICVWPTFDENFEVGTHQLGSKTGTQTGDSYMYANWWVRNTNWSRGGTSGARTHYSAAWDVHRFIPLG